MDHAAVKRQCQIDDESQHMCDDNGKNIAMSDREIGYEDVPQTVPYACENQYFFSYHSVLHLI